MEQETALTLMTKYVTPREAGKILQFSEKTLRTWDSVGKIDSIRTPSNQRRYDIDSILGDNKDKSVAIYARVSSHKQKEDLERQADF